MLPPSGCQFFNLQGLIIQTAGCLVFAVVSVVYVRIGDSVMHMNRWSIRYQKEFWGKFSWGSKKNKEWVIPSGEESKGSLNFKEWDQGQRRCGVKGTGKYRDKKENDPELSKLDHWTSFHPLFLIFLWFLYLLGSLNNEIDVILWSKAGEQDCVLYIFVSPTVSSIVVRT